ncbi:kinase-like domain-containing protein [Pyrenochaeta sp. MPI-SDFR-AT-0127]|nr:kinase-like domain-containing protein [Pyrenochaeta sp. MPI-SDFR-AT-0127]
MGGRYDPSNLTQTYYSVFGLLVYVEHPLFIIGFLDRNCSDHFLESWVTHTSLFSRESLKQYTGDFKRDPLRFERFAKRFATNLPKFAVPHLESERFSQFDASVVLPFIEETEIGKRIDDGGHLTSEGANGKVFAFKIHREYNKFPNVGSRAEFARKRIETAQPLAFLERSNILYAQRFGDDHIVKLIKAYGHGESINLIFPRAWTNLDHLLRDTVFRYGEKRGARLELANAWKQLLGIARALKKIQGFGDGADSRGGNVEDRLCIHFDLKPDNILVEREDGNWLITDFGQAALTQRRRGMTPRIGGHFGTDAYAPPEIEDTNMEFGRAYDIWSLGCIMLEVTTFMVIGYAGLKGVGQFQGLDQARQAMPTWARGSDERFFYQEAPNGGYVVKKEIREFMASLEKRHARSPQSSEESKTFLNKILDLINRMLNPIVQDRVDISRVVDTLSSALKRASVCASDATTYHVVAASDETILGGPQLNQIGLLHWSEANKEWESSNLEVLENEAGFMRLHRWAHGRVPNNINFRRSDVKIIPLYAFWDPMNAYDSRTWINFVFLSANRRSEVSDAKFSFDGNSGLEEARIVQSKLTSQNIVGSFALSNVGFSKPLSVSKAVKGLWRKLKPNEKALVAQADQKTLEFGSATVQIWVEQEDEVVAKLMRRESVASQATATSRAVRIFDRDQLKVRPCRVAIYLHEQRFVCTIRIDVNWVLEESTSDNKVLRFKPHPQGGNRPFYASWIRPTQEELEADCPAGIPLSPKVLFYYEDLDSVEVEEFDLTFLSTGDREDFKWKFWEVKRDWDLARQKLEDTIPINRMPEKTPQPPDGVGLLPVPRIKAQLTTRPSRPTSFQSSSSGSATRSRHDSTLEETAVARLDPTRLMVPDPQPSNRRSSGGTWRW